MKTILRNSLIVLFFLLIAGNLYIFVAGMYLSDEINQYDVKTKELTEENTRLEKEVYQLESYQYAASMSAVLQFTKQSQPVYFDDLKYALNR